jgi:hypothetical protein
MDSITPLALRDDIVLRDEERQPCEIWTRVMGYHRPVASFNRGKQGEYRERTYFIEGRASACCIERAGD